MWVLDERGDAYNLALARSVRCNYTPDDELPEFARPTREVTVVAQFETVIVEHPKRGPEALIVDRPVYRGKGDEFEDRLEDAVRYINAVTATMNGRTFGTAMPYDH